MRKSAFCTLAAFCLFSVFSSSAWAQQNGSRFRGNTVDENAKKLDIGAPRQDLSGLGREIAPGVLFQPTLTFETGYSSNPNELFTGVEGSPYGLTNATGVFGFLKETGATTLTLRSTYLQYDGDIDASDRWDAGIAVDNAYVVAPGMVSTFGAYYLRDELAVVASNNAGGYGQLAYSEPDFETFGRVKVDRIGYLGSVSNSTVTPTVLMLLQPQQFSYQRIEGVSGFIFGPRARVGVYGELGGAGLHYYDQSVETILDRDATDLWAIGGLRFNLHPSLVLDAGWRLNVRQVDDPVVDDQTTHFFDGRLTWTPLQTLRFVVEVDRKFSEPITTLAVVGDTIHYGASAFYQIRPDVEVGASLRHDRIEQIGDGFEYHETELGLSAAYQWSQAATIYGLLIHEHVEEQLTGQSYDRFQVGGGAKVKF